MMTGKISTHHASRRIVLPKAMSLRSAEDPAMGVPHVANRLVTNHTFANWNLELSMAKAWEVSGRSTDLGNDSRRRKLPDDPESALLAVKLIFPRSGFSMCKNPMKKKARKTLE